MEQNSSTRDDNSAVKALQAELPFKKRRPSREEQVRFFLFGTTKFTSEGQEFLIGTLAFVFLGFSLFLFLECLGLREYFLGLAFLLFTPIFALSAWASWKDSTDGRKQ